MTSSHIPLDLSKAALRLLGKAAETLSDGERRVLRKLADRRVVAQNPNEAYDRTLSFGERLADRVAAYAGSWSFIILFAVVLMAWMGLNSWMLVKPFDPYPYILLNLALSTIAALQAPVIMMSQNRQSARDRIDASNDYQVNLKSEIAIMAMHDKLDQLRSEQIELLLSKQREQLELLSRILAERKQ